MAYKINPWSYDPRVYLLDVLSGSRYQPNIRRTNGNANYFTFKVVAYSYRRGLLLEDDYTFILTSTVKPIKETNLERRKRNSLLMKENGWTRAELSRQLG